MKNLGHVSEWYFYDCLWHLDVILMNPEGAPAILIGNDGNVYLMEGF